MKHYPHLKLTLDNSNFGELSQLDESDLEPRRMLAENHKFGLISFDIASIEDLLVSQTFTSCPTRIYKLQIQPPTPESREIEWCFNISL
jgi:hypothetical protein